MKKIRIRKRSTSQAVTRFLKCQSIQLMKVKSQLHPVEFQKSQRNPNEHRLHSSTLRCSVGTRVFFLPVALESTKCASLIGNQVALWRVSVISQRVFCVVLWLTILILSCLAVQIRALAFLKFKRPCEQFHIHLSVNIL